MVGRGTTRTKPVEEPQGFDAFELRLGDIMRGERATLGKSLLDVQRELKIKAAYIAAIENADPSAFDTPGFIAGYVRSYARYLNMDPDWAFDTFCRESGFSTAHGMSAAASARPAREEREAGAGLGSGFGSGGRELFGPGSPFLSSQPGLLANVEPRAVGSVLVLGALLAGLGYGGWMVLREVQKVTFAPVEQPPAVVAEVDPLAGGAAPEAEPGADVAAAPAPEALERLYRPEALEVPVLTPRDGPIAALDPGMVGTLAPGGAGVAEAAPATPTTVAQATAPAMPAGAAPAAGPSSTAPVPGVEAALAAVVGPAAGPMPDPSGVRVTAEPAPPVQLVAVRESWVRVRAADGSTLFEGILAAGDTFDVPSDAEPATLRTGESGALYMALGGVPYGPVGPDGAVSDDVALSAEDIAAAYRPADIAGDPELAEYVAVASAAQVSPAALPATLPPGAAVAPASAMPTAD